MSNQPGHLYIVSAPSGGGKTSLTRALVTQLAELGHAAAISVSYTTRAPRPGEVEGTHYHFVDDAQFLSMIERDAFLEHANVFGRRYGTGRQWTEDLLSAGVDVILDIDWQGAQQVRRTAPQARSIFILPPSLDELRRRLRGRGQDDEATIAARMASAKDEMSHHAEYDSLIVNEDFDLALQELCALFIAPKLELAAQLERHAELISELTD